MPYYLYCLRLRRLVLILLIHYICFDFAQSETFAKFLSLPTAETQTQVFSCFQLFSPQISPNSTQIPP
nr:hypothetical protein [Neisseria meningitidis]